MALPRGFKARAEKIAEEVRAGISAAPDRPLDLHALAAARSAKIVSAGDLVALERLQEIERLQAFAFSACTFDIQSQLVIVYNPIRKPERRASDIAHELAHLFL